MRESSLSSSAYVVLGLLATYGPATPYDLKRWVDDSIGYFWSFPRAQLYVEPERLAAQGLLTERREGSGRRRRVFSLTDAGRQALQNWIRTPDSAQVELRDPGLLKLFFGGAVEPADLLTLAREEQAHHATRLADYERILPELEADAGAAFALATIRLGIRHEQLAVEFWREIADDPPQQSLSHPLDSSDVAGTTPPSHGSDPDGIHATTASGRATRPRGVAATGRRGRARETRTVE